MTKLSKGPKVEVIESIGEFVDYVESQEGLRWFRGHGRSDLYKLKPALYRTKVEKSWVELSETEFDMIKRFRQKSVPFVGDRSRDQDLDILFFMQHYHIPTRLLDWSENPSVALYFALHDPTNMDPTTGYIEDCAVWVLAPEVWNESALKTDRARKILSSEDPFIVGYNPIQNKGRVETRQGQPVAIEGRHNSPRIVAQRGVFMIYGSEIKDMEELFISHPYPKDSLIKLVIPKEKIEEMRTSLYKMGITDSAIYPDLQGLAVEMKRTFGY